MQAFKMAAARDDDYTDPDDIGVNASTEPSIGALIERRSRARCAARSRGSRYQKFRSRARSPPRTRRPRSTVLVAHLQGTAHTPDGTQHVAEGYDMQVLIRWGDPIIGAGADFDSKPLTAAEQEKRWLQQRLSRPLSVAGSCAATASSMVANHTNPSVRRPGVAAAARR